MRHRGTQTSQTHRRVTVRLSRVSWRALFQRLLLAKHCDGPQHRNVLAPREVNFQSIQVHNTQQSLVTVHAPSA